VGIIFIVYNYCLTAIALYVTTKQKEMKIYTVERFGETEVFTNKKKAKSHKAKFGGVFVQYKFPITKAGLLAAFKHEPT
jgi:hypothetical protein